MTSQVSKIPLRKRFHFSKKGEDGTLYEGDFVVRRPNVIDQTKIQALRVRYTGGIKAEELDAGTLGLAESLSFLKSQIEEAPEWWKNDQVYDFDVLTALYMEAIEIDPFRRAIMQPESEGGASLDRGDGGVSNLARDSSSSEHKDARSSLNFAAMVDE